MLSRGTISESDFPVSFTQSCQCIGELISAINQEIRVMLYRRQYSSRLREKRGAVYNQYADVASVLKSLAGELGSELTFEPELERKLKRYLAGLNIDANAAVFRDRGGRLRAEIYGDGAADVRKDKDYLEKLSALLGTRLCTGRQKNDERVLLLEAEPLAVSVGIAAVKKRGQPVSGDRGTYFKTEDGILYIILSDGMGTGEDAARCSESAIRVLERFLRAGVPPETAMRMLNDLMLLKNETDTVSATVDLMCVDLFSGEAAFYKYGAAPSYVLAGRNIRRVKGETLAAGLSAGEGTAPDVVRMRLKPGCTAVIATDGVIADSEDEWLKSLLLQGFDDMKGLARAVLKQAEELYGALEDMTVVTVRVEERP
jgi:stage II sporulation protein E